MDTIALKRANIDLRLQLDAERQRANALESQMAQAKADVSNLQAEIARLRAAQA